MNNFFKHLHVVNKHRFLVCVFSFKLGIPWRGLIHDLSKYSPKEFWPSVKYFDGHKSPLINERLDNDMYSSVFTHHTRKNKHHYEYWMDQYGGDLVLTKMPYKYALEHVADVISASKTYNGKNFTKDKPLEYFELSSPHYFMHSMTVEFVKTLLTIYKEEGFKGLKHKHTKQIYKELDKKYPLCEMIEVYSLNHSLNKFPIDEEVIKTHFHFYQPKK